MSLPVNIEELLNGQTVEWERIECKRGWNPEDVIHTIGAFANDINNWGGGYIFIGVAEKNGVPQLPPVGVHASSLDGIQKELLNLGHKIQPYYTPVYQPYILNGKHILAIWVPGGDNRPYKVPTTLGAKGQNRYYVRRGSSSVIANHQEEQLLLEMAKRIPFDDRVNHHAKIDDLSFGLIRSFLEEIKSDLAKEAAHMSLSELAQQMRVAGGPSESLLPLNVGLLFFSEKPDKYFPGVKTDVVLHQDKSGTVFTEKTFTGPVHQQLRNVLSFIQTNIIKEKVIKISARVEVDRIYNFPLAAVEEVVANSFYHRSYEQDSPIEINCFPDRIEVLSFPGPLPPVTRAILKKEKRIVARKYRNRRVGDFLKELRLTEGRATGFPTIYNSMHQNGSPKPIFDTDDDYTYFLAVLPIHPEFLVSAEEVTEKELQVLLYCMKPKKRAAILKKIGLSNHAKNYQKYIVPLIEKGWLAYTSPDIPTSPNQQYITTEKGKQVLG
ncbi:RNA-binding domain-containing protein [Terrimonas pollutisoli]|uniref:RNA-binding domain-containing protein n=1 Tax=Terrimonas pollutisoli TaxID=3034147 RepID=UPI0023EC3E78|nr:RNA-binding domain-containing protein [Terrimonas sp. H1YJ31]